MKEEQVDVVDREVLLLEFLHQRADHALDGMLEDEPAFHVGPHEIRLDLADSVLVDRNERTLADVPHCLRKSVRVPPIGAQVPTAHAAVFVGRADDHRACTVAEQ